MNTIADVVDAAAVACYCERADVMGTRKYKSVAMARKIALCILRDTTPMSLPQLGRAFHRDHTTVMSAVRSVRLSLIHGDETALAYWRAMALLGKRAPGPRWASCTDAVASCEAVAS